MDETGPQFRINRVELLKQERQNLRPGETLDVSCKAEVELAMLALFGTPDHPRFPFWQNNEQGERSLQAFVSVDRTSVDDQLADQDHASNEFARLFDREYIKMAAGAVSSDERGVRTGLYREHCAHCHGLAGDGAGSTAGFLNPYPRDFRLGKFKFKSTPLRQAPTHDDMIQLLVRGIPGTAMPSFKNLPQEHLEALADYVRYLSVRGQFERFLIAELSRLDGDRLLPKSISDSLVAEITDSSAKPAQHFFAGLSEGQIEAIKNEVIDLVGEDILESLVQRWFDAEDRVTAVPDRPAGVLSDEAEYADWVDRGFTLFLEKGNCAQCHVVGMLQANELQNFDDWTNEWVNTSGVDPFDKSSYREFLKAGALPPRPVRPRILDLGVMRGGDEPEQIYRRIANGIEGTPMPSAPTLSSDEIWALVAYVKSLRDQVGEWVGE